MTQLLRLRNDYVIRWPPQFQLHGRYTLGTTSAFAKAIAETKDRGPKCSVGIALKKLSGKQLTEVQSALDNPDIQHAAIMRGFQALKFDVGRLAVGRHRNGECRCGK